MVYVTLNNYNLSLGPQIMVCYVNDVSKTLFMPFLYLAIWCILVIGSFMITKKMTGSGDFPVSMSLGSFITLMFAGIMRLIDCPYDTLTSNIVLGVLIGLSLLSTIFLLGSKD